MVLMSAENVCIPSTGFQQDKFKYSTGWNRLEYVIQGLKTKIKNMFIN